MEETQSQTAKEKEAKEAPQPERAGLRTYARDFGASISGERGDIIRRAIREAQEKEAAKKAESLSSRQNKLLLLGSALAVAAGIGLVAYVVLFGGAKTIEPPKSNQVQSVIFADTSVEVPLSGLTREGLFARFADVRARISSPDAVTNVFFTDIRDNVKYLAGSRTLLSLFATNMPELLGEALENASMLGVYAAPDDAIPFLILKTHAYNEAFSGLRAWEGRLFDDTYRLFGIPVSGKNSGLFAATFQDATIENKDARVLKNTANEIVLLYAFADDRTIIITTDPRALKEVLSRLTSQKVEQAG